MTPALEALARRLAACRRSGLWIKGMRTDGGLRVYTVGRSLVGVRDDDIRMRPDCSAIPHDALPDLTDPATVGLLPAMARDALGCPAAQASPWTIGPHTVTRWRVCLNDEEDREFSGATETEAWIVAMESAS